MKYFPLLLFIFLTVAASAQRTATAGFWNTENFFDTIPDPKRTDDSEYTPAGIRRWDTKRYRTKVRNVARVLDEMALDVVGLAEVENESVVRDLVMALLTDYNYIVTPSDGAGGRGLALLYKGDRFVPQDVRAVDSRTSRPFLYVRGELMGERVDLVVCHLPSMLNGYAYRARAVGRLRRFVDSLHVADTGARLVVAGDLNATPRDRVMRTAFASADPARGAALFNPLEEQARGGAGSYAYNDRWLLYDNIYVGAPLMPHLFGCAIFIKPWMLHDDHTRRDGYPLRTFTGAKYTAGYSDHLPVYVVFRFPGR